MKITKTQLKNLIREQVKTVLESPEWFDVYGDDYPGPQHHGADNTEASMTPNDEVEAENALLAAIEAAVAAGYTNQDIITIVNDVEGPPAEADIEEDNKKEPPPVHPSAASQRRHAAFERDMEKRRAHGVPDKPKK